MTLAAFMRTALYDETRGYYTSRTQRSGRAGDFYTSVDAGSIFGDVLATFVARVAGERAAPDAPFDLVEAGAGNGRLMRDVLDTLANEHPALYERIRVTLVEASPAARDAQAAVLHAHAGHLAPPTAAMPARIDGCLFANELLDAMPAHRVIQTRTGLAEWYVDVTDHDRLILMPGPLSTPELADYFAAPGIAVPDGVSVDVSLDARAWVTAAAHALERGSMLLIDYGDRLQGLLRRREGTLMAFRDHRVANAADGPTTWLADPGDWDMTTHVDWTMVSAALLAAGLTVDRVVDQTHFLLSLGVADRIPPMDDTSVAAVKRRLTASTLVSPHGLGSSHQALVARRTLLG